MIKVLANDGMHASGVKKLEAAGVQVHTQFIAQEALPQALQEYDALVVRSATKVRKPLIDACPNLKFIGRGGVGMDNIDVEYAQSKGIAVHNTPDSSSESVAELVMGHLYGMARYLYAANREMPGADAAAFKRLKDAYGKGMELRGRTLGIIGCGRIGQALARLALGAGMHVLPHRRSQEPVTLTLTIAGLAPISVELPVAPFDQVLAQSDFISLNLPSAEGDPAILGPDEFSAMRKGVCIVNAARGGAVAELALLEALNSGQVAHAALDVFEGEPSASPAVLSHPRISLSPHIGAATVEAQARIGTEMAGHLLRHFGLSVHAN